MWWSSGARVLTCIATTSSRRFASRAMIDADGCSTPRRSQRRSLTALHEWLAGFGVTLVGMEATGVYWKTVFQALEDRFECWLCNAQHLRNVALV
jgi:transposase